MKQIKAEIDEGRQEHAHISWSGLLQCKKAIVIGCGLMLFQVCLWQLKSSLP
jgi:type II secretory pathway component PulM